MGFCKLAVERNRPPECPLGVTTPADRIEDLAEIEMQVLVSWRERRRLLKVRQRLVRPAFGEQHAAQVVVSFRQSRVEA